MGERLPEARELPPVPRDGSRVVELQPARQLHHPPPRAGRRVPGLFAGNKR